MPWIFHSKILSKLANGLVAGVSLFDRSRLASPVDGGCGADMRLLLSTAKAEKLRRRYSVLLRVKPAARLRQDRIRQP